MQRWRRCLLDRAVRTLVSLPTPAGVERKTPALRRVGCSVVTYAEIVPMKVQEESNCSAGRQFCCVVRACLLHGEIDRCVLRVRASALSTDVARRTRLNDRSRVDLDVLALGAGESLGPNPIDQEPLELCVAFRASMDDRTTALRWRKSAQPSPQWVLGGRSASGQ
jgi:hypothetical protein